jgi:predicted aldo/keto reductase-like oxidoreductase
MEYRINRKTGDRISEIGFGTSYLYEAGLEKGAETVRYAYEHGINYFDLAAGDGLTFPIFGKALADVRKMFSIRFISAPIIHRAHMDGRLTLKQS